MECCSRILSHLMAFIKVGKTHTYTLTDAQPICAQAEYPYGYSNFSKLTSKKITYLFLPLGFSALYNKHKRLQTAPRQKEEVKL